MAKRTEYRIERRDGAYFVAGRGGSYGGYPSEAAAAGVIDALRAEERRAAARDPRVKARRQRRAAYRTAERDPVLSVLKKALPRRGEIARKTAASQARALAWLDGALSFASSSPKAHAQLKRTRAQRQTVSATEANTQRGQSRRQRVIELWQILQDIPSHHRAARIAAHLGITPEHVRRLRRPRAVTRGTPQHRSRNGHFVE